MPYYDDYDDGNNWSDMKKYGMDSEEFDEIDLISDGYSGYLGTGDKIDYAQFYVSCPSKLSFSVYADASVKLTIYKLSGKEGKYSLKSLQATSTKKYVERYDDGDYDVWFEVTTAPCLIEQAGYYYVSVSSSAREVDYSVYLNQDDSVFFDGLAYNDDDWTDLKQNGAASDEVGELSLDDWFNEGTGIDDDWVGMGDAVDYRRFYVDNVAKLSLTIESSDVTKVSICQVTGREGKYSLKALASATAAKVKKQKNPSYDDDEWYDDEWYGDDEYEYSGTTKAVLLQEGEYFLAVESPNAKKGGSASYSVYLASGSTLFDQGYNGDDWDDMKENGEGSELYGNFDLNEMFEGHCISDWVGMGDTVDYRKFTVDNVAKLSFSVYATDATKISIFTLAGSEGNYSLKPMQATPLAKNKKPDTIWTEDMFCLTGYYSTVTKPVLLSEGTYFLAVESTNAKKGASSDYAVFLNVSESSLFDGGNNDDDWTDMKEVGAQSEEMGVLSLDDLFDTEEPIFDWVGMGDAVDFRRFTIDGSAKLSLSVYATDAASVTVYALAGSEGNYSLKALQTSTVAKLKTPYTTWNEDEMYGVSCAYGVTTKSLMLEGGEYFLAVQSTNAQKGGSASYMIMGNFSGTQFFDADNGWNNQLLDKSNKVVPEAEDGGELDVKSIEICTLTDELLLDASPLDHEEWITYEDCWTWDNFVGFGDEYDYAKVTLSESTKLSFSVSATDAAKFSICQLAPGKTNDTRTIKVIQSTTLTKKTDTISYWDEVYNPKTDEYDEVVKKAKHVTYVATTKSIQLGAGDYYICMQSTNAKKGGGAYYNVYLNEAGCGELPEPLSNSLVASPDADNGWNNFVYDKKYGSNPDVMYGETTDIKEGQEIYFDNNIPQGNWHNFVGYGDEYDYARIRMNKAGQVSFSISATDPVKFSVYRLRENYKTGGYELTAVSSGSLQKAGTMTTKALMLEAGEYFVSMQSTTAKKGGAAYYNVEVNSLFTYEADGGDNNWLYNKNYGVNEYVMYEGPMNEFYSAEPVPVTMDAYGSVWRATEEGNFENFVGFGDSVDYAKFVMGQTGKISFQFSATDAVKFSIHSLTLNNQTNQYVLKTLQSTELKNAGNTKTNMLSLAAGEYYLSMESTNADQGGAAYYNVAVNTIAFSNASSLSEFDQAAGLLA